MKIQSQTVVALTLGSAAVAFCPHPISQRPSPTGLQVTPRESSNDFDLGTTAMSLLAASVIAVSASTALLPVEPAMAAPTPVVVKVDLKKLPTEERNLIMAKKNLDLSEKTLKEYQKYVADAKATDKKVSTALKAQEKVAESAKKAMVLDSDKLSAAKSQKMPDSAIKELTVKASKSKEVFKTEEKKLSDLSKEASKASKELKSSESSVEQSKSAIKSAKSKLEKAEKDFKNYTKKVQEQKKKEAEREKKAKAAAEKALQEEEKKIKALEAEQKKLAALKETSSKELEKKAKLLEAEKKSLEKLKTTK